MECKQQLSIGELLEIARETKVSLEQIKQIKTRLVENSNDNSLYVSKEFLDRTYGI